MTVASSLLIGALLGLANAAAAVWTVHRATLGDPAKAMNLVLGGMAVRMSAVLALVALLLVLFPLHRGAFIGGLGVLFVGGLIAESALALARAPDSTRPPADA